MVRAAGSQLTRRQPGPPSQVTFAAESPVLLRGLGRHATRRAGNFRRCVLPTELRYVLRLTVAVLVPVGLATLVVVLASPIQRGADDSSPRRVGGRPSRPASARRFPFCSVVRLCPDLERLARGGGADRSSGCRHPRVHRLATCGRDPLAMTDEELVKTRARVRANDRRCWLPTGGA